MSISTIIAGILTGITASMGLGGGFILIIFLTVLENTPQTEAGGINLLFFLPIALISIIIHTKNRLIEWRLILKICAAGVFGVAAGALLLNVIDEPGLRKLFAALLVFVGLREMFHRREKNPPQAPSDASASSTSDKASSRPSCTADNPH